MLRNTAKKRIFTQKAEILALLNHNLEKTFLVKTDELSPLKNHYSNLINVAITLLRGMMAQVTRQKTQNRKVLGSIPD